MAEEIKNENTEEITEDLIITEEIIERQNPFCVISKKTFEPYNVHDIQCNSAWSKNPYGDDYAIVPDDMVKGIVETRGFCDIELNEDKTEVVSYTALEIPEISEEEEVTEEDITLDLLADHEYRLCMIELGMV